MKLAKFDEIDSLIKGMQMFHSDRYTTLVRITTIADYYSSNYIRQYTRRRTCTLGATITDELCVRCCQPQMTTMLRQRDDA